MTKRARRSPDSDFSAIDGVSRKTAKALRKAGIASMAELGAMSASDVARALRGAGKPIRVEKIIAKEWLQQAWRLADGDRADEVIPDSPPLAEDSEPNWEEYAGYFVYFDRTRSATGDRWRTRVWDTRELVEEEFPGTGPAPWVSFLLGRARLPVSARSHGPRTFEVASATIEHRETSEGRQTWLRTEVAVDTNEQGAFEAALGSAMVRATLQESGKFERRE